MRPLRFDLYDIIAESGRDGPDYSALEMSQQLNVGYSNVRATLSRMNRRGIIKRIGYGIYRTEVRT